MRTDLRPTSRPISRSFAEDRTTADRVRSELGPLLKMRDQPRVHVQVTDGVAMLHGDVTDIAARAAIEARVLDVAGVRGLRSKLHIGLLRSDSRPSSGHRSPRLHPRPRLRNGLRAADVMTRDLVSVGPETTIFGAYDAILRHRVHHLPVVTPDGRCIALLDLVGLAERMPEAWMTGGETPLWQQARGPAGPLSVLPDTPLRTAAAHMDAAGVDACCVTDELGRLLGLITSRDVIAAVAGRVTGRGDGRAR